MRTALLGVGLTLAGLVAAPTALAKSYHLTNAVETFRIQRDGSVLATEALTFAFSGSFHGAYRLIPAAPGESIDQVQVSADGVPYNPGADARVGSAGAPQTYGVITTDTGWTQVAWHFDAQDSARMFIVSYRMHGYVRAYSDVGNLYLQVWGDQWPVRLDRLQAVVIFPGPATKADHTRQLVHVWGHPASVSGSVAIAGPDRVTLDASNIPARQFVEIDTTFPRHLLAAAGGSFVVRPGQGLALVAARERRIYSSPYGPGPAPVASPAGGGGIGGLLKGLGLLLLIPAFLFMRFFGFGGASTRPTAGALGGFGGSLGGGFGGSFGGGGGGGGGGAW